MMFVLFCCGVEISLGAGRGLSPFSGEIIGGRRPPNKAAHSVTIMLFSIIKIIAHFPIADFHYNAGIFGTSLAPLK